MDDTARDVAIYLMLSGPAGCRICICDAHGLSVSAVERLKQDFSETLGWLSAFSITLGNYRQREGLPIYKFQFVDPHIADAFRDFYRRNYIPDKSLHDQRMYPEFEAHIIVDTKERLKEVENVIRAGTRFVTIKMKHVRWHIRNSLEYKSTPEAKTCCGCNAPTGCIACRYT